MSDIMNYGEWKQYLSITHWKLPEDPREPNKMVLLDGRGESAEEFLERAVAAQSQREPTWEYRPKYTSVWELEIEDGLVHFNPVIGAWGGGPIEGGSKN